MKRFLRMLMVLLVLSVIWTGTGLALVPSSGTVTSWSDAPIGAGDVRLFQVSYVTASSGGTFTCSTGKDITGWIILVETDPGATAPTTLYDVTLVNANGRDVMGGALADRSATLAEAVLPSISSTSTAVYNDGLLTITVTAAGNSKTAEILIYYLP